MLGRRGVVMQFNQKIFRIYAEWTLRNFADLRLRFFVIDSPLMRSKQQNHCVWDRTTCEPHVSIPPNEITNRSTVYKTEVKILNFNTAKILWGLHNFPVNYLVQLLSWAFWKISFNGKWLLSPISSQGPKSTLYEQNPTFWLDRLVVRIPEFSREHLDNKW